MHNTTTTGMSQSLPKQVILGDIDSEDEEREAKRGDKTTNNDEFELVLRERRDPSELKHGDYHGFRSSYKRAIDHDDITPPDSPRFEEIDIPIYLDHHRMSFRENRKSNNVAQ